MIRFFSTFNKTVLGIGDGGSWGSVPLYQLNASRTQFSRASRSLGKNTDWQVNSYAYNEDDGNKYLQVSTNEWVKFVNVNDGRILRDKETQDFQMAVSRNLQTPITVVIERNRDIIKEYEIDIWNERAEYSSIVHNDGERYYSDMQLEKADAQKHVTGYRVTDNGYYDYNSVFLDNKLTFVNATSSNPNVTPISKIIRVNSVIPDVFDSNGNAVYFPTDAGQQFMSDGVYVTPERVGFRIAEDTFINLNSASGTTLLHGHFLPKIGE
ncbi:hypothetical protein [Companilactobacillus zhongbaensis]|uniref:hypothetical protein n=1 Tax=Companilactobacillus zhongbaensis TaxID=2486009 RepID=UPI000F7A1881|nr:hypothetical protein [Companilactobacillus zhongbaensis]